MPTINFEEHVVEKILNHRQRGRGFQLQTLMNGFSTQDAAWQLSKDFVDADETVTEVWEENIRMKGILQQYN